MVFIAWVKVIDTAINRIADWVEIIGGKIYGSIETWRQKQLIRKELDKAIENNLVESFISDHPDFRPYFSHLEKLARWRAHVSKIQRFVENNMYREETIQIFLEIVKEIDELEPLIPFDKSGIKLTITDTATEEKITVHNEVYFGAILLRFAATAWTQIAYKYSNELGIAISYDAEMDASYSRYPAFRAFSLPEHEFAWAYYKLLDFYSKANAISAAYLNAVSYLKAAEEMVKRVDKKQEMHQKMSINHLKGLALGFRGEAQYWLFKGSENVPKYIEIIKDRIASNENTRKLIAQTLELEEDELENEVADLFTIIGIYENIPAGFAGSKKLFEQALDYLEEEKERNKFSNRFNELLKMDLAVVPDIVIGDPEAIYQR